MSYPIEAELPNGRKLRAEVIEHNVSTGFLFEASIIPGINGTRTIFHQVPVEQPGQLSYLDPTNEAAMKQTLLKLWEAHEEILKFFRP